MTSTSIILFVAVGLIAGWLAGKIWKGSGFGALGNLAVGVAGSFIGGIVFKIVGLSYRGLIGSVIAALAGALILLYVISLLKK
jgi:uncharacterized membrane protein YeaQ/YmgE (transglycosylase-associated protein family)